MQDYLKRTVSNMRQELTEFLPQSLLDVVEPKDILRMHQYKIGNELIKNKYRIKTTDEYINLMNWYEAKSKIQFR